MHTVEQRGREVHSALEQNYSAECRAERQRVREVTVHRAEQNYTVQSRPLPLVLREKSLGIEKSGMMGARSRGDNGATTRRLQPHAS